MGRGGLRARPRRAAARRAPRRRAALATATDVYVWHLLRRREGLGREATRGDAAMVEAPRADGGDAPRRPARDEGPRLHLARPRPPQPDDGAAAGAAPARRRGPRADARAGGRVGARRRARGRAARPGDRGARPRRPPGPQPDRLRRPLLRHLQRPRPARGPRLRSGARRGRPRPRAWSTAPPTAPRRWPSANGLPWAESQPFLLQEAAAGVPPFGLGMRPMGAPLGPLRDRALQPRRRRASTRRSRLPAGQRRAPRRRAAAARPPRRIPPPRRR